MRCWVKRAVTTVWLMKKRLIRFGLKAMEFLQLSERDGGFCAEQNNTKPLSLASHFPTITIKPCCLCKSRWARSHRPTWEPFTDAGIVKHRRGAGRSLLAAVRRSLLLCSCHFQISRKSHWMFCKQFAAWHYFQSYKCPRRCSVNHSRVPAQQKDTH